MDNIFIYGPPGSGKSTLAPMLAESLAFSFIDLDELIVQQSGQSIPDIFSKEGEIGFRRQERKALESILDSNRQVIALGGGALLNPSTRGLAEQHGKVLCLNAGYEILLQRMETVFSSRPLLTSQDVSSDTLLRNLLNDRKEHYLSFQCQLDTSSIKMDRMVGQAQTNLGMFNLSGMGKSYDVRVLSGGLDYVGEYIFSQKLGGPVVVVTDETVAPLYLESVASSISSAGFSVVAVIIPAGEGSKTVESVFHLWNEFVKLRLDRGSTVVALGGGVVGDLAGFAAATFLRGISWVNLPTTLLSMVDASLGGKTGADLPGGKNLVGAFHAPRLVLVDPHTLVTLPEEELRSGMAEVIKHGIIADPLLFDLCSQGWEAITPNIEDVVKRAMRVKIEVIEMDPYEKDRRAVLNLGHTFGHALEAKSDYQIRHGEAIAVGMVVAANLAVRLGVAEKQVVDCIQNALLNVGLPIELPGKLDWEKIVQLISMDKKRVGGITKFVLPLRIGEVGWGYGIDNLDWIKEM